MLTDTGIGRQLFELLVESLDIPPSLYERAVSRHRSLGEWLCRDGSRLREFSPHVSPQARSGSAPSRGRSPRTRSMTSTTSRR